LTNLLAGLLDGLEVSGECPHPSQPFNVRIVHFVKDTMLFSAALCNFGHVLCSIGTDRTAKVLWTFGRGNERVRIGRGSETCDLMVMTSPNQPQRYSFKDWSSLNAFQADIEALLLNTGWTLLQYSPERRRGRDRRGRTRVEDRRRWWTDSAEPRKSARTE
jgi:hypothetical protein